MGGGSLTQRRMAELVAWAERLRRVRARKAYVEQEPDLSVTLMDLEAFVPEPQRTFAKGGVEEATRRQAERLELSALSPLRREMHAEAAGDVTEHVPPGRATGC